MPTTTRPRPDRPTLAAPLTREERVDADSLIALLGGIRNRAVVSAHALTARDAAAVFERCEIIRSDDDQRIRAEVDLKEALLQFALETRDACDQIKALLLAAPAPQTEKGGR